MNVLKNFFTNEINENISWIDCKRAGVRKTMTKGIIVAGLSGGSGKSVVAVGLVAAYTDQEYKVVPFKKGPDYIDAGWLQLAAGQPCYNLDP